MTDYYDIYHSINSVHVSHHILCTTGVLENYYNTTLSTKVFYSDIV